MRKLTRNQWAAVGTGFVLVAAAGFGLSAINQTEPVPQTAEEPSLVVEETAPVDVNQNAPTKTTANTAEPAPQTAQAETEDLAEAPVEETPITAQAPVEETAGMTEVAFSLQWPLEGEIGLDYAETATIYDPTLEQYRTNDTVAILAEEGTPVEAAGDGTVSQVAMDEETGMTVVITHPEGWVTTYSQLAEAVAVSVGDTVTQGEVIGQVGTPSKYGVALGSHLDFQVALDDRPLDPKAVLGAQ